MLLVALDGLAPLGPQGQVEVGYEAGGHRVDGGIEAREGGCEEPCDHKAAHADGDVVLDVLRENVARVAEECGAQGAVSLRVVDVLDIEQKSYTQEDKHHRKREELGCHERTAGLLYVLAGKLTLHELLVGRVLGNLEECHAYHTADDGVGLAEVDARVEHLHLAARHPAAQRAVCGDSRGDSCRSGGLDHTACREGLPDFLEAEASEVAGHHYQAHHAGEYHQQGLECVDVQQALDAAHHSVEGGDDAEDDDAPDHKLELYAAERDDADGDGCDEEAASACQQLAYEEHHGVGLLGAFAEALSDEAVDGDGLGVV